MELRLDNKLIKVSRNRIVNARFGVTSEQIEDIKKKLSGKDLEDVLSLIATPEEEEWYRIFNHDLKGLERYRRKISVCWLAEILELEDDRIVFEYSGDWFEILAPSNSYKVFAILDASDKKDYVGALKELSIQGRIKRNDKVINIEKDNLPIDELNILRDISTRFFFQSYLE